MKMFILLLFCCLNLAVLSQNYGSFKDERDGRIYKTITLGTQTWLAENLTFNCANSWCYNDDSLNCIKTGRLYKWETAKSACPAGWHLPSLEEWDTLIHFLGGYEAAGGKLHIYSNTGFKAPFAGRRLMDGTYTYKGNFGFYWTKTETPTMGAWCITMSPSNNTVSKNDYYKSNAISVRCIKD